MTEKRKNSLYIQGLILALAGFITKIIGFIYRIPVANILGEEGNGIYSDAFLIYGITLTMSSYSLPLAVSKLVSARVAKKEYKNVRSIFLNSLLFALIVGSIAALILFAGSDFFERMFKNPGLSLPLRILAPTVFIVAFLGVFRGFFQGHATMIPTAVSQIVEQIANAIVSIVAAVQFTKIYAQSENVAAYGASGSTLGTLSGTFVALLFLIFTYFSYRPVFVSNQKKQTTPVESTRFVLEALVRTIIPVIISQTIYQIGYLLDSFLFGNIMVAKGMDASVVSALKGVYSTQYNQLINLPVAIATAMASSTIPAIVKSNVTGNLAEVQQKTNGIIKFNMVIAFPCAVGLTVLSAPIIHLLYPSLVTYESYAVGMLTFGSSAVVFYALSTITTAILQGNNYMKLPVIHSGIALVIHIIVSIILLAATPLSIYGLMIGNVLFPLIVCILNCRSLTNHLHFKLHFMDLFGKPLIASIFMGIGTWTSYQLFFLFLPNAVSLILSILIACILYFALLNAFKCFTYDELLEFPMGSKLAKLFFPKEKKRK